MVENMALTNKELRYAIESGLIDLEKVSKDLEKKKNDARLKEHLYDVWQGKNTYWYTYLPDKLKGRRLIKKKDRKDLDAAIIEYYQSFEANPSLNDLFYESYTQKVERGVISDSTYTRYENIYKKYYARTGFGAQRIMNLTERELSDFIVTTVYDRKLKAKEYGLLRTITSGILKYAKHREYTDISPTSMFNDIDLDKKSFATNENKNKREVYTVDEMRRIKDYVEKNSTVHNISALLLAKTGMRAGECVALKWEDIDIASRLIHIHRTETTYRDRDTQKYVCEITDTTKTENGNRFVVIDNETCDFLNTLFLVTGKREYLFTVNGRRIRENAVRRKLERICKAIGITYRSPHKLRRGYATELAKHNVPKSVIISQMGHSDYETTEKYYIYDNEELEKRKEIIESAITY